MKEDKRPARSRKNRLKNCMLFYLPLMLDAIENTRNADSNIDGYMPQLLQTKVYQLGRALYDRMGKVCFETPNKQVKEMAKLIGAKIPAYMKLSNLEKMVLGKM